MMVTFNVCNPFSSKYISMMGQSGLPAGGDYQSLGAMREYFGMVSTEF
ncbi:hypothetical protein GOB93_10920 [Acetobacter musti]|uniref:Uncharacterized protein n=1 Tax=Acetobacter musti TaxID=864732 RepID=A0ABX0JUD2_9PROT|nr:hypothetical protein [Acetobacter musti]